MMKMGTMVHVCGSRDLEGMNDVGYTPRKLLKFVLTVVPTYARPYKGNIDVAGFGFYNICAVYHKGKYGPDKEHLDRVNNFKKYVESRGIGTVTIAPDCYNPHYGKGHIMRPAIFTPDTPKFIKWGVKEKIIPKWEDIGKLDLINHLSWSYATVVKVTESEKGWIESDLL